MALKRYFVPITFHIEEDNEADVNLMADAIADLVFRQFHYDSDIGKVEERD